MTMTARRVLSIFLTSELLSPSWSTPMHRVVYQYFTARKYTGRFVVRDWSEDDSANSDRDQSSSSSSDLETFDSEDNSPRRG